MNYTTLVGAKTVAGSIKHLVNYDRIDAAGVLLQAETEIYKLLRVREMRMASEIPVSAGAVSMPLPERCIAPLQLIDITTPATLTKKPWPTIEKLRTWTAGALDTGVPAYYGIYDEACQFDVRTEDELTYRLQFYGRPEPLSEDAPTNFLTTRYPAVLKAFCGAYAADEMHDDANYQRYLARGMSLIEQIRVENDDVDQGAEYDVGVF